MSAAMKVAIGVLAIVAAAALFANSKMVARALYGDTWTYRYRLTLEVETPEGVATGSSVFEIRGTISPPWNVLRKMGPNPVWTSLRGEAVAVDLGARGVLFAILQGRHESGTPIWGGPRDLPTRVFRRTGQLPNDSVCEGQRCQWYAEEIGVSYGLGDPSFNSISAVQHKLETMQARAELTMAEVPFLVRFRDIADPKTVEAIEPSDLDRSFGDGVKLARATIEMTSAPVTVAIEQWLPWLRHGGTGMLDGRRYHDRNDVANSLTK